MRSFYAALVRANYVVNNPFAAQRIRVAGTGVVAVRKRSLSDAEWAHVLACIARRGEVAQATVSPELRAQRLAQHHRLEAAVTTLVDTGLRLAEVATARLGDVRSLGTHAGVPLQVLSVVGKGSKPREVPIGAHTLDLIRRHHASALGGEGRAVAGSESEQLPLLLRLRESPSGAARTPPGRAITAALGRSGLHRTLKTFFESVRVRRRPPGSIPRVSRRLRHTGCATPSAGKWPQKACRWTCCAKRSGIPRWPRRRTTSTPRPSAAPSCWPQPVNAAAESELLPELTGDGASA